MMSGAQAELSALTGAFVAGSGRMHPALEEGTRRSWRDTFDEVNQNGTRSARISKTGLGVS